MDLIREWVRNLFIIILILAFTEMLLPDSSISKYIRFIFSLLIMSAIVYPLFELI